ncbi:MAG: Glycosyl transferase family 2 [Candidatus Kentron sp. G]|nr:MAG: Glycosyl transferase family 2 [Candidatus Kentron sp. G]VFN01345.1 MAG: Glycosyl transferase family 2 [Candidatus Kentron sp. G]VFN02831.1 MAG: Glycosyl transferase family 2 [Candidatus Kentron sp. G]
MAGALDREIWSDRELWAAYWLGMYDTVAHAEPKRLGWRGTWARAVSLAACGEAEAAREAAATLARRRRWARHLTAFADDLAPFMPRLALRLIEERPGLPAALHAALLLRNGRAAEARIVLGRSPRAGGPVESPELCLLRTNAWGGSPAEQLNRLNAFLAAHGLSPVRLVDAAQPPSPGNVIAIEPLSSVDGPLVTVLMTTFGTGARAVAAIASLRAQSYRNLELIVVDDASADGTAARVDAVAVNDPRIRTLRLTHNVGAYAAKLIGLTRARGEFVTCHDSDDWSHPEKIARQVAPLLANRRLICTTSSWVRMQDDGLYYARPMHPLMRLNPSSPLFRRERVLQEAGAWDCVRTGADSEFLARLRVVFGPRAIKKIGQPLTLGGHRPDSLRATE